MFLQNAGDIMWPTSCAVMSEQTAPWLPKILLLALDIAQKPYYFEIRNSHVRAVFTTAALFGLAPMRSTRASAAHHRESISACQPDVRCSKP